MNTHPHHVLTGELGNLDIYLFDQIAKGRFVDRPRVLDAGCGHGRNLIYLLRSGHDVWGVDPSSSAIDTVRSVAATLRSDLSAEQFQAVPIEACAFEEESFDAVLSNAVLHFATDPTHFEEMLRGAWRFLAPGGLFFCRLATTISVESVISPLGEGQYRLGDGSKRFLVDLDTILEWTDRLGGRLLDPVKTTNVQNLRAMTTWVVERVK